MLKIYECSMKKYKLRFYYNIIHKLKHESMMNFAPLKWLEAFSLISLVCGLGLFSISLSYCVTFEVFAGQMHICN